MSKNLRIPNSANILKEINFETAQRIKRLEHICLILSISVLLLAVFSIVIARTVFDLTGTLELFAEQINLIGQKIDTIREGVQNI